MRILRNCCRRAAGLFLFSISIAAPMAASGATFVVTVNADSGAGSLRQAVADSNALLGSNNIVIATSGTITLFSGELLITNNAHISGPGAGSLSIQANYSSRVFHIVNAAVTLSDLTVANGSNSLGGGILQESGLL